MSALEAILGNCCPLEPATTPIRVVGPISEALVMMRGETLDDYITTLTTSDAERIGNDNCTE